MIDFALLASVLAGIGLLLILILKFKIQAFISLLISSIVVGILAGLSPSEIISTIQEGMGSTLGFVATVVGLGAMFGAILEYSGGAEALARSMITRFGEEKASWSLMGTGFIVAIPVFFDVAFIILVPIVYALQRKTGKSLFLYAIPLLSGLAITHAFIPPTPGPVAVADILGADLGWIILFGFIAGAPAAILSGPVFAKYVANKIHVSAPEYSNKESSSKSSPSVILILTIIGVPIFLILANTLLNSPLLKGIGIPVWIKEWFRLIGHPFVALIIANLLAWYLIGLKRGASKSSMLDIMSRSMAPAGIIILLTGAGGVFKQTLVDTGTGEMLANYFAEQGLSLLIFAYLSAVIVRIMQGSATVAMITAAGLTAPLLLNSTEIEKALLVIAIASGASILSHVNDSGFWLVSKYLGINEKDTFKSWTVSTTILSITGFSMVFLLSLIF